MSAPAAKTRPFLYVFDMGGVVSEHCFVWKQICGAIGTELPEDPNERGAFMKLEAATMRGDITSMEMLTLLAARIGRPAPRENYWATFFRPVLRQDTVALIRSLKAAGNRVVCGTNTIDVHYESHVACGDYALFDAVYASHLIGQVKPDITFWHCIKDAESRVRPCAFTDMVFFDDMQQNVDAAASLGIHAHRFTTADDARAYIVRETGGAV